MSKMKKVLAMILALAMIMGMTMTTMAADVPSAADKKEATVTNVEAGATITAYQIVKGSYNTSGFVEYVKADGSFTLSDVLKPTSTDVTTIADAINDGTLAGLKTADMSGDGAADLEAGYWVVLVTGADLKEVYNPMLIGVYYNVGGSNNTLVAGSVDANSSWSLEATPAFAKSSDTRITKNVDKATWDLGDLATYTVTAKVPEYSAAYDDDEIEFKIVDKAETGELEIQSATITIKVGDTAVAADDYTLTSAADTYTVDFDGDWVKENKNATVTITYKAKVVGEIYANDKQAAHNNTVTLTYTNAPGTTEDATACEAVYTFKVEDLITKTGEDADAAKLAGAVFTIYTDEACTTEYTNTKHADGTVTSDANGKVNIYGLDLGTYYIKETVAPEGYSLNNTVYKVEVKADVTKVDNADDTVANIKITVDGKDSVTIPNTKLVNLPSTGGIGTTIFTIAGCGIMLAAAYLFFASRRREDV